MRTPKTEYRDGIVVKFSVTKDVTNYEVLIWEFAGNKQRKIGSGIFNDNLDEIFAKAREQLMENPKQFGYDHKFWMSKLESQNMTRVST